MGPINIKSLPDSGEGEQVVERQGEGTLASSVSSVAERTAGILARYRSAMPASAEEERAAFGQAVAEEVADTPATVSEP